MKPHLPLLLRKYLLIAFASLSINAAFAADWVNGSAIDLTNEPYRLFDEQYKHLIGDFTFTTYNDVEQSSLWTQGASLTQNKGYSSDVIVNGSWQLSRYPGNHTTITVNGNLTFNGSLSITYTAELNAGGILTFNIDQALNDKLSIEADKLVVGNGAALDIAKATALKLNSNDIIVKENATLTISDKDVAYDVCLQGANLTVNAVYDKQIKSTAASIVEIGNNVELKAVQLDASAADVTLSGSGSYTMESGANTLGTGVSVASGWRGTVKTTDSTTALELDKLGVSGSKVELGSDTHTLADRDQSVAADLSSTGSVSLEGKELTLSGSNTLGSLRVGTLKVAGGSTALTGGLTTTGESSVADGANLSIDGESSIGGKITLGSGSTLMLGGNTTLGGMISNSGTVNFGGTITVDSAVVTSGTRERYSAGENGYKIIDTTYTVLIGNAVTSNTATWMVGSTAAGYENGMVIVDGIEDAAIYHVRNGDVEYTQTLANDTTTFSLVGGHLVLKESLKNTQSIAWNTPGSWVNIESSDVELKSSQLSTVGAGSFTLTATNGGTYIIDKEVGGIVELTLGTGVTLPGDYWWGTVKTVGDTTVCSNLDTTSWKNTELNGTTTVKSGVTLTLGGNTKLGGKISNSGTLYLNGTIMVDKDTFAPADAVETVEGYFIGSATKPNSTQSGFKAACWDITIAEGGSITDNGATWQLASDADADFVFETDGTLHAYGSDVDSVFHVAAGDEITYASTNASDFVNRKGTEATAISLNGGTLVLNTALRSTDDDYVKSTAASTINIGADTELNAAQLDASAADVTLIGSGTYNLESGMELGAGVKLSSDTWIGTVRTGAVAAGTGNIDVNHLGTAQSSVQLGQRGDVSVGSLAAERIGTVKTPGALTLLGQTGTANNLEVQGMLTLGTAECATRLTANGELSTRGIKLGNIGSSAYAEKLNDTALNLMIADSELLKLTGGSTTVLTLGSSYNGETSLNGEQEVLGSNGKMIYSLAWQNSLSRATSGTTLLLTANTNPTYVQDKVAETIGSGSRNGKAGCTILNDAYATQNPQYNTPESNLADLIDTVDAGLMTDCNLAAVSGASVTVLGQAFSGDIERQLRAIRNRAESGNDGTICSITDEKSGLVSTMSPTRFFAWVNAEGNRAEQDADGTAAGYTMNSWGGTMGVGMTLNNQLTMGLALTAMYGNLESDAADYLDGDMDTYYLSAFARYNQGAWNHSFIGTVGTMESDYRRTVNHSAGSYQTVGDTEGTAFGLMYELSRDFALNSKSSLSPVFNISYRHTEVDGYSESGSDAALSVGEQSLDTVTAGLGARYAAAVGQTAFNRTCAAEARVLVKYDMGDTQTDCSVGFIDHASRARIESAELGAWGVELGAGISVPVGYGSIFADGSVELRNDYTNMNATVGYRIQF